MAPRFDNRVVNIGRQIPSWLVLPVVVSNPITIEIEGIGSLTNPVRAEAEHAG